MVWRKAHGVIVGVFAAVTLVMACSANDLEPTARLANAPPAKEAPSTSSASLTGLPCAVETVLREECQTCHAASPTSGASTSLMTWTDLQGDHGGKKLYELVKDRIHAESGRMPPAARLSTDQIAAIDDWVATGAPKSNDSCTGGSEPPPATKPFVCNAPNTVTTLKAAKPFTWSDPTKTDQYMCFGVDEVVAKKKHIIGLGPSIDNLAVVHHVLLFQSQTGMSNEAQPCSETTSAAWKLVSGWAPGGGNIEMPPEAGFPAEGTTHWILQVHYNNASGKNIGASDNSGYQLCETEQLRPNDAGMLAFGSTTFAIPPRTAKHTISCDYKLPATYKGVKFFLASPHMHKRGTAMVTERLPGGNGAAQPVFGQDPFNFENQEAFPIDVSVAPGDVMRTRCSWKNTGDTVVGFGEKTDDEMCFNFLTYYPNIPDQTFAGVPVQTWVSPSLSLLGSGPTCTTVNE